MLIILSSLLGAAANRYAGSSLPYNRSLATLVIAAAGFIAFGLPGIGVAVAFYAWRSVGWYDSIDMGRNGGNLLQDMEVMTLINCVFAVAMFIVNPEEPLLVVPAMALAPTLLYAAAMNLLPWKPQYRHIAVAEVLSGAALGALCAYALST